MIRLIYIIYVFFDIFKGMMTVRVIAGTAKSLKLIAPEGRDVRPTLDRTKETLFNMIHTHIAGSLFLDIFSGSGAIGIEALSRGAQLGYFIEHDPKALSCIEQNLTHTHLKENAIVLNMDFGHGLHVLKDRGLKFDIIFLDPPFNKGYEKNAITKLLELKLLNEQGILVCESATETPFDFMNDIEEYCIYKEKIFKTSKFTFIQ